MTSAPKVSVIMAFRNSRATILQAVQSVLAQSLEDFEFIVVDDGSTDDSRELIVALGDSRIRLLTNVANLGLAASLNRGIDAAVGKYIARMDADDLAYPERLETQLEYLEIQSDVDLLGASVMVFSGEGRCAGVLPTSQQNSVIQRSGRLGFFPLYHPTWMGKANWFRTHRYDETFKKAQDFELLLRAASTSTYSNVNDVLLAYRYSPTTSLQLRLETRRYVWRAMRKNFTAARDFRSLIGGGVMTGAKALRDVVLAAQLVQQETGAARLVQATDMQLKRWGEVLLELQARSAE